MNEPAPKPGEKKKVWVRIFDNEETERRLQALPVDEFTRNALRQFKELWHAVRYGDAVEVPPPGEYFFPPREEDGQQSQPPPVEQVEDRVVVTKGEPKVTRTRRRMMAVRPRKRLPWVTDDDLARKTDDDDGKPGPKPLLDDAAKERVCMCLSVGLSRNLTAADLGVARSTLSKTIKRDPEFKRRVLQAEAKYEKSRVLALLQAARESWRAGAWMFKNYHPHMSVRRLNRQTETRFTAEAVEKISQALEGERKAG